MCPYKRKKHAAILMPIIETFIFNSHTASPQYIYWGLAIYIYIYRGENLAGVEVESFHSQCN